LDLSNDISQAYIKTYEMTMIVKKFKTYVSLENLGLSQREIGFLFGIRILRLFWEAT
jgi:hypothetical protein